MVCLVYLRYKTVEELNGTGEQPTLSQHAVTLRSVTVLPVGSTANSALVKSAWNRGKSVASQVVCGLDDNCGGRWHPQVAVPVF
jgi:hypothetical protein